MGPKPCPGIGGISATLYTITSSNWGRSQSKRPIVSWLIRESPPKVSMWPCKHISHIQVFVINFCPTPPIKLKLGLQVRGRLLIANPLEPIKPSTQSETGSSQYIPFNCVYETPGGLLQGPERCAFSQGSQQSSSEFTGFDSWTSSKMSIARSHTEHGWRWFKDTESPTVIC